MVPPDDAHTISLVCRAIVMREDSGRTMGYDRFPELLIDEKSATLERVMKADEWLFLTRDPDTAVCQVARDAKGRFSPANERADLVVTG